MSRRETQASSLAVATSSTWTSRWQPAGPVREALYPQERVPFLRDQRRELSGRPPGRRQRRSRELLPKRTRVSEPIGW